MFLIFLLLWIILNGRITAEILIFGVIISAGIYATCCVLFNYSFEKDRTFIRKLPEIIRLFCILLAAVCKTNFQVAKLIYSRRQPAASFITFNPELQSLSARVALAECITLTPGTITGDLENGSYTIHCLDDGFAGGVTDNMIIRQLKKLEGDHQQ